MTGTSGGQGDTAVEVRDLSVSLSGTRIVDSVDATVEAERFVGLVGPNGAGKTTLLRAVNGRLEPDSGTVSVAGRTIAGRSSKALGRLVATVPQRTALSFPFPVRDVVEMGRFPHRSRFALSDPGADRVEWAMARTAVDHLADRPVTDVSGGERQRVLLARALAQDTPVLLLDEPTANLDVNHQVRTLSLVRDLVDRDGRTVVAAIHDLDLAARFCDEIVLLSGGLVRAAGAPEDVLTEATVEAAFDTSVAIGRNPVTGTPTVTALPERTRSNRRGHVHVIGGGGRASSLLHRLVVAGFAVSVGVVHENDADAVAARALDVDAATVPDVTPVDDQVEAAIDPSRSADVSVFADLDVGPVNEANLDVAAAADRLVVVDGRPFEERNHAGPGAARRYAALVEAARVVDENELVPVIDEMMHADRAVAADGGP